MKYLTVAVDDFAVLYGDRKDIEKLLEELEKIGLHVEIEISSMCG